MNPEFLLLHLRFSGTAGTGGGEDNFLVTNTNIVGGSGQDEAEEDILGPAGLKWVHRLHPIEVICPSHYVVSQSVNPRKPGKVYWGGPL